MEDFLAYAVPVGPDLYTVALAIDKCFDHDGAAVASFVCHDRRMILLSPDLPREFRQQTVAAAVSTAWRERIGQYAADLSMAWDEFSETIDAVADPETDADAEDMAIVFAQFSRLRRLGVRFDPGFIIKMGEAKADAIDRTDTFAEDGTDGDEENDDPDEDVSDDDSGIFGPFCGDIADRGAGLPVIMQEPTVRVPPPPPPITDDFGLWEAIDSARDRDCKTAGYLFTRVRGRLDSPVAFLPVDGIFQRHSRGPLARWLLEHPDMVRRLAGASLLKNLEDFSYPDWCNGLTFHDRSMVGVIHGESVVILSTGRLAPPPLPPAVPAVVTYEDGWFYCPRCTSRFRYPHPFSRHLRYDHHDRPTAELISHAIYSRKRRAVIPVVLEALAAHRDAVEGVHA